MTDLKFVINSNNFLQRNDSNAVLNQVDDEYVCYFTFEHEDWTEKHKFASFSIKNHEYIADLGSENICSTVLPYAALSSCIIVLRVFGEDISAKNNIAIIVNQPKTSSEKQCPPDQSDYQDAFMEAYYEVQRKFDDVKLINDDIIFYSKGREIKRVSLGGIDKQSDWTEADELSTQFIRNKPSVVTSISYSQPDLEYSLDGDYAEVVSLAHTHMAEDITDFDGEVDVDLNDLLIRLTNNIRSL